MEKEQKNKDDSEINFEDAEYQRNIFRSLLLLTLAVSGNFVGSTLSCQVQYQMTNNVFIKHVIILFIIYLTLTVLDPYAGNKSPVYSVKNTLIIWAFYIMFTKQDLFYSSLSIVLLAIAYISDQFVMYYDKINKDTNPEKKQTANIAKSMRNFSFGGSALVIIVGFASYLISKQNEYGDKFDITKFIFGTPICDSLK